MINKLSNLWNVGILLLINLFIFTGPIKNALFTLQPLVFITYFTLYVTISFLPFFILKGKWRLAALVSLIIFSASTNQLDLFLHSVVRPIPSRKIEDDMFVSQEVDNVDELKMKKPCFPVFFPTYFPITPYEKVKLRTIDVSLKACNKQIVISDFSLSNLIVVQVPSSYDYSYRGGFENLGELRNRAITGKKIFINNNQAYLLTLDGVMGTFPDFSSGINNNELGHYNKLLFLETDKTSIFMFYILNPHFKSDEDLILQMVESMTPIN